MQLFDRNGRPIVSAKQMKEKGLHVLAAAIICSGLFALAARAGLTGNSGATTAVLAFWAVVALSLPILVRARLPAVIIWLVVIALAWFIVIASGIANHIPVPYVFGTFGVLGVTFKWFERQWKNGRFN